jgi:alpha-amylase/alpha-mannosidase (GH57 family)
MSDKNQETDLTIVKVEKFIKQIHEKDIELKPIAQTLMMTETVGKNTWGSAVKVSRSLADMIGEKMHAYQEILNAQIALESYVKATNEETVMFPYTQKLLNDLDMLRTVRKRQIDMASELFRYIEQAYSNNAIDEIGLGKKLKAFEEENEELKKKNASLQKVNDILARENTKLHRLLPDAMKDKGEVGDLGKLDS